MSGKVFYLAGFKTSKWKKFDIPSIKVFEKKLGNKKRSLILNETEFTEKFLSIPFEVEFFFNLNVI